MGRWWTVVCLFFAIFSFCRRHFWVFSLCTYFGGNFVFFFFFIFAYADSCFNHLHHSTQTFCDQELCSEMLPTVVRARKKDRGWGRHYVTFCWLHLISFLFFSVSLLFIFVTWGRLVFGVSIPETTTCTKSMFNMMG